jgi:hypothetical protein
MQEEEGGCRGKDRGGSEAAVAVRVCVCVCEVGLP